jgi:hypothetical protein
MFDKKLPQSCMIGETVAAAIAKFCADLPDVATRDRRAAQGAIAVHARGAVIDNNEAEHVRPPLGLLVKMQRGSSPPLLRKTDFAGPLFP